MNEKRVLLAALLSFLFLSVYSSVIIKRYPPQTHLKGETNFPSKTTPSIAPIIAADTLIQQLHNEDVITIESAELKIEIGATSASVRSATLPKFSDTETQHPLLFGQHHPLLSVKAGNQELKWKLESQSTCDASFVGTDDHGKKYHISYQLNQDNSLLNIELYKEYTGDKLEDESVYLTSTWHRGDSLSNRQNRLELFTLSENNGKNAYKHFLGAQKKERIVPRGTSVLSLAERYFCQVIRSNGSSTSVTLLPSRDEVVAAMQQVQLADLPNGKRGYSATVYIGPRDYFYLERVGLHNAFPIGVLGRIGLVLLFILNGIAGLVKNFGVAIILFSAAISLAMAPFTLLSIKSMRKMQELKPQVDRIMAKQKSDPQKANQEMLALYRQHKVSPLSGCLPMLLQMPIFIAMFQAISHFIELRGQKFLWIRDLSLPDRAGHLPFSVPILGNELNVLPIVMAAAMYLQTQLSQKGMSVDTKSNPMAGAMGGPFMSILFGVMFYQFPSGLVLYWLTNSLISISVYRLAKPTATTPRIVAK